MNTRRRGKFGRLTGLPGAGARGCKRISRSLVDAELWYRCLAVRGNVVAVRPNPDKTVIDRMAA